ncbi:hypothetical protein Tsubulata_047558 [Turnera subulata]|uniref:Cytochrome P450 n=1 Tax=Turnera subulata TaxID=218843 RepID=A0A9Q0JEC1_9ROSI|nr:hypothetical protein Tsubulata_047558 [Turnera subulata]
MYSSAMVGGGTMIIYFSGWVSLCFLWLLSRFLNKVWWTPFRIQSAMSSQGIKGPSYRFFHGNSKEIISLRNEAWKSPMELCHQIFPRVHPHVYLWKKLYGKNFLMWKGSMPLLVVTESELIKEILNNRDGTYLKPDQPYLKKLLGNGLITTRGEKWFKLRKLANHAFHGESLKRMVPEMVASTEVMIERWKQQAGNEIEVFRDFKLLTSEVISRTAFGSSYLEGQRIFDMLTKMVLIFSRNIYTVRIPGIRQAFSSLKL